MEINILEKINILLERIYTSGWLVKIIPQHSFDNRLKHFLDHFFYVGDTK